MKLSIIVPVYNEAKTILEILNRVEAVNFGVEREIIVIDDGSTDGTTQLLESRIKNLESGIRIIFKEKNEGKGAAMRRGFEEAKGEIIVIQDADLEYNPEELPKLVQPILDGRAEAVYGRRIITENQPHYALFAWGNKCLSLLFYLLYGRVIHDPSAGYKLFKKSILADLNLKSAKGFDVESELTSKILKHGYKIIEMPVHYQPRTYSQGKKIKWGDGLRLAWTIVKFRFID